MANGLKKMTGDEFIEKILVGERDFRGIYLSNYDFANSSLRAYLESQYSAKEPLNIEDSYFRNIWADNLNLSCINGMNSDFSDVHLKGSNLINSNFRGSQFNNVSFVGAHLIEADLSNSIGARSYFKGCSFIKSNLKSTNLKNACFKGSSFYYANLYKTDLRGIKGLESVQGLDFAHFLKTIVTEREKEIIENAIRKAKRFDFRE
tara:strand:- start:189 stop:803 length:615 start_codon:yes stop_codon:yes gene_type:complete